MLQQENTSNTSRHKDCNVSIKKLSIICMGECTKCRFGKGNKNVSFGVFDELAGARMQTNKEQSL